MVRSSFNAHVRQSQVALRERVGNKWSDQFWHLQQVFGANPRKVTCISLKCTTHFESHSHQGDPCMICAVGSLMTALDGCRANEWFLGETAGDVSQLCDHVVAAFTEWDHLEDAAEKAEAAARRAGSDAAHGTAFTARSDEQQARRAFVQATRHMEHIAAVGADRAHAAAERDNARAVSTAHATPGRATHLASLPGALD